MRPGRPPRHSIMSQVHSAASAVRYHPAMGMEHPPMAPAPGEVKACQHWSGVRPMYPTAVACTTPFSMEVVTSQPQGCVEEGRPIMAQRAYAACRLCSLSEIQEYKLNWSARSSHLCTGARDGGLGCGDAGGHMNDSRACPAQAAAQPRQGTAQPTATTPMNPLPERSRASMLAGRAR